MTAFFLHLPQRLFEHLTRSQEASRSQTFKASKTVASPGRWLMWCTAKTLRCSIPSRLTLERPKRLSCDLVIDATDSATLSPHPHPIPLLAQHRTCVQVQGPCVQVQGTLSSPPHPTPTPPHPITCVAPTMCASARNMMLRSTDHLCKCKERYHPHPTPTPPHPIRSTDHVCKCKEHDVA